MIAMAFLASALGVVPADAAVCDESTKRHIFAHDVGAGAQTSFSGVAVTTLLRAETLDPNCVDIDGRWSAAHMSNPGIPGGWIEIGWATNWTQAGARRFKIFFEIMRDNVIFERGELGVSQPATSSRFKVERNPAIGDFWKFFYDLENDQSYQQMGLPDGHNGGFSFGWAKAETGRRANSSAYDDLQNLWSRRNPGVWMQWTTVIKDFDDDPTYHCHRVTTNRYQVHTPNTDHSCT